MSNNDNNIDTKQLVQNYADSQKFWGLGADERQAGIDKKFRATIDSGFNDFVFKVNDKLNKKDLS